MSGHVDDETQKLPSDIIQKLAKSKDANAGILNRRQVWIWDGDCIDCGDGADVFVSLSRFCSVCLIKGFTLSLKLTQPKFWLRCRNRLC